VSEGEASVLPHYMECIPVSVCRVHLRKPHVLCGWTCQCFNQRGGSRRIPHLRSLMMLAIKRLHHVSEGEASVLPHYMECIPFSACRVHPRKPHVLCGWTCLWILTSGGGGECTSSVTAVLNESSCRHESAPFEQRRGIRHAPLHGTHAQCMMGTHEFMQAMLCPLSARQCPCVNKRCVRWRRVTVFT